MQTLLFWLSKLVNPLISPLTVPLLAAAAAGLSLLRSRAGSPSRGLRGRRRLGAVSLVLTALLYLASLPAVSNLLVGLWEVERTEPESLSRSPLAPFDAIVVLGGSVFVETSGRWHIETGQSAERLTAAARLYRQLAASGTPPKVILSGGSGNPAFQERGEAPLAAELLELMGVPEGDILLEERSRNTWENGLYTGELMEGRDLTRAVLVTSALHMRRSRSIFAKLGIPFEPFAVDTGRTVLPFPNMFFPDTYALDNAYRTLREMAGYAAYAVMGRL